MEENEISDKKGITSKWGLIGLGSALYLMNLTFGVVEFIPDAIPLIGNVDEAALTMVFLKSLVEMGFIGEDRVKELLSLKERLFFPAKDEKPAPEDEKQVTE